MCWQPPDFWSRRHGKNHIEIRETGEQLTAKSQCPEGMRSLPCRKIPAIPIACSPRRRTICMERCLHILCRDDLLLFPSTLAQVEKAQLRHFSCCQLQSKGPDGVPLPVNAPEPICLLVPQSPGMRCVFTRRSVFPRICLPLLVTPDAERLKQVALRKVCEGYARYTGQNQGDQVDIKVVVRKDLAGRMCQRSAKDTFD